MRFFQHPSGHKLPELDNEGITSPDYDSIKKRLNGEAAKLTNVELPKDDEVPDLVRKKIGSPQLESAYIYLTSDRYGTRFLAVESTSARRLALLGSDKWSKTSTGPRSSP